VVDADARAKRTVPATATATATANDDMRVREQLKQCGDDGGTRSRRHTRSEDALGVLGEMYVYLMRDATGRSLKALAIEIGVSESHERRACCTYTNAERQRWVAADEMLSDEEYDRLCPCAWETGRYSGKRIQMWDNTDAARFRGTPTDAYVNNVTFSDYYGGNVLKGGVGTTPWGYVTGTELRTGGEDDSSYFHCCDIIARQQAAAGEYSGPPPQWAVMEDKSSRRRRRRRS